MVVLFDRDKSVISRHIKNVFEEKELIMDSVVAKFAYTATDEKVYQSKQYVNQYNYLNFQGRNLRP